MSDILKVIAGLALLWFILLFAGLIEENHCARKGGFRVDRDGVLICHYPLGGNNNER